MVCGLTFSRGGTNYTVTGQRFDIIQKPRLIIYVTGVANRQTRQAGTPVDGETRIRLESEVRTYTYVCYIEAKYVLPKSLL